ncbi:23S rRNA pseudouridine(1911/1915/1917) synthase RluD [Pantoea sp. Aalb]|uniref:23S rRNA pseudouridine(1911/1915/1917) synthase RluD n=1 Tax=Pantoea sp. Aalb TaxID=2576762 RepID=UPI00132A57D9|nr:23S rRNA pseudouridine(1911/1915/1917) synthase RluD [Pantoea sp. Aalb]MXP67781.1 23S rRNA pseudouridine(1911/1915/1917) synthase RluD [Pantoea sp. Aalb]
MTKKLQLMLTVSKKQCSQRLDRTLAELFPDYSLTCIKKWIIERGIKVNNIIIDKPKKKIFGGEYISIDVKINEIQCLEAQNIPLDIIYEDQDILIINKTHNLVVHPGPGNLNGTILNALLYYYPPIASIPRAGIVHRLDKNTTGLMVIAKTITAQIYLIQKMKLHEIIREYEAVVSGNIIAGGMINEPIARHSTRRTLMSVCPMGKPAITQYRIIEHFRAHTYLRLRIETGRTHQIRVHMAYIKHPLVGDLIYGHNSPLPKGASNNLITILRNFNRQALHAKMIRLYHPISGLKIECHAPLPNDMSHLITALKIDTHEHLKPLKYD